MERSKGGRGGGSRSRSHYNSGYHSSGFSGGLPLVVGSVLFFSQVWNQRKNAPRVPV